MMKGSHFFWISTIHALFFTLILAFLSKFKFVPWKPVNWTKTLYIAPQAHFGVKWILTFVVVLIAVVGLIGLFMLIKKMPAIATSIVVGVAIWLMLEWAIYQDFSHISWNSIPIATSILMICRGLAETISYYDREVYDEN